MIAPSIKSRRARRLTNPRPFSRVVGVRRRVGSPDAARRGQGTAPSRRSCFCSLLPHQRPVAPAQGRHDMARVADLLIHGEGSIYLLRATSRRGQSWVVEHISDDRQEWAGAGAALNARARGRQHAGRLRSSTTGRWAAGARHAVGDARHDSHCDLRSGTRSRRMRGDEGRRDPAAAAGAGDDMRAIGRRVVLPVDADRRLRPGGRRDRRRAPLRW
jgi:hypothetical protein